MRPPRRPQSSERHSFRMELVLEFDGAVGAAAAKEAARRVMDGLGLSVAEVSHGPAVKGCRLVCHDLRRSLPLLGAGEAPSEGNE